MSAVLASLVDVPAAAAAALDHGHAGPVLLTPHPLAEGAHRQALGLLLDAGGHAAWLSAVAAACRPDRPDGTLAELARHGIGPGTAMPALRSLTRALSDQDDLRAVLAWARAHPGAAAAAIPALGPQDAAAAAEAHRGPDGALPPATADALAGPAEILAGRAAAAETARSGRLEAVAWHADAGAELREVRWPSLHPSQQWHVAADLARSLTVPADAELTARRWSNALSLVDSYTGTTTTLTRALPRLD